MQDTYLLCLTCFAMQLWRSFRLSPLFICCNYSLLDCCALVVAFTNSLSVVCRFDIVRSSTALFHLKEQATKEEEEEEGNIQGKTKQNKQKTKNKTKTKQNKKTNNNTKTIPQNNNNNTRTKTTRTTTTTTTTTPTTKPHYSQGIGDHSRVSADRDILLCC